MKTIIRIYLLLCLLTCILGCRTEDSSRGFSLNKIEYFIGNRLSSISADGDSICMIGTRDGDIYLYDIEAKHITDTLRTGTGRIYKVMAERDARGNTCYWVGASNAGLIKYLYGEGGLKPVGRFVLNDGEKKFSTYDFIVHEGGVYLATSSGLQYSLLTDSVECRLTRLDSADGNTPMRTIRLMLHGRDIYAASAAGLLRHRTGSQGPAEVLHPGVNINDLMPVEGRIHALAGNTLYIDCPEGGESRSHLLATEALLHFHADNLHYFINEDRIDIVADEDIDDGNRYRSCPMDISDKMKCNNIVLTSDRGRYFLLLTENSLLKIPFHQDIYHTDGTITAACHDGDRVYMTVNNSLFLKSEGSSVATKLADLPQDDRITSIMVKGNTLFYVNRGTELKRMKLYGNYFLNTFADGAELLFRRRQGFTATYMDASGRIYIGIRDNIVLYDDNSQKFIDTSTPVHVKTFAGGNGDTVCAITLNHDIQRGTGATFTPARDIGQHTDAKDMAFASFSDNPCILTARHLFSPDGRDSVETCDSERLLTADGRTFFTLPEYGIRKYIITHGGIRHMGDTLCDIQFSPELAFAHGGKIYVGAPALGMMEMDSDGGNMRWTEFNHITRRPDGRTILLVLVALMLLTLLYIRIHRNNKRYIASLREWETVAEEISSIDTPYFRHMAAPQHRGTKAMREHCTEVREHLAHYKTLVTHMNTYRQLAALNIVKEKCGKDLTGHIQELDDSMQSADFDLSTCACLKDKIEKALAHVKVRDIALDIKDTYTKYRECADDMDPDFGKRLSACMDELKQNGHQEISENIDLLLALDKKYLFVTTIKEIATGRDLIRQLTEVIQDRDWDDTQTEEQDIDLIRENINGCLDRLYATLSAEDGLLKQINFAPLSPVHTKLTGKDRGLMLLIIYPETDWNVIRVIYKISGKKEEVTRSINNLRATISKAKAKVIDNSTELQSNSADSMSACILHIIKASV